MFIIANIPGCCHTMNDIASNYLPCHGQSYKGEQLFKSKDMFFPEDVISLTGNNSQVKILLKTRWQPLTSCQILDTQYSFYIL